MEILSYDEKMKIFDFLLENKQIKIDENGLFSRDTLITIRKRAKEGQNLILTQEQEQAMIDAFLNSNTIFNEDTPIFILQNEDCIKATIDRDLNSINFIKSFTPELKAIIIEKALQKGFILRKNSPNFLKSNYNIAENSILLDASSADFIFWNTMDQDHIDHFIDLTSKNGYILSDESHSVLYHNPKIVLASIKRDLNSIEHASAAALENLEIFTYSILHGYHYGKQDLQDRSFNQILNPEVFKICLEQLDYYGNDNELYKERFNKLFYDAITNFPSIRNFETIFQMSVEKEWKEYRKKYSTSFENIFGRICAELRNSDDFDSALSKLPFLQNLKDTLDDKYNSLYKVMEDYFYIYHSNTYEKLEKLKPYQDVISELSALYIAKSKENYKKKELSEYYEWLQNYFVLRIDHPTINKRIRQKQQKEVFKKLYYNKDKKVIEFLNHIADTYSELVPKGLIYKMINEFLIYDHSNIERIEKIPYGYSNYERFEKATKLIHRLNSGYITYDGVEVAQYKDIIAFDHSKKEYVYTGINFSNNDLFQYSEFRKKEKLFKKIKKDISLKIKEIKIDKKIDKDDLMNLEEEFPFNDEYFEFDKDLLDTFALFDLYDACMDTDGFNIDSFIDDESFAMIYHLLIHNGMAWFFLLQDNDYNHSFEDLDGIIKMINDMKKIINLSKSISLNTTNLSQLLLLHEVSNYADSEAVAILGMEVIESFIKEDEISEEIILTAKELVAQMTKRNKSTVPFVSGKEMNYKYSLYDSQDETLLLAGIQTNACFRCCGVDNDFLHYSALDKNGFVIKITNLDDNFIARASGFRNGNCVFINQLRTIYDKCGGNYLGTSKNEQNDIIKAFKQACEDIVATSQQNKNEIDKIDFVFVTKSYILEDYDSNVPDNIADKIGDYPMDHESEDWENFLNHTKNLEDFDDGFTTDYGGYPLICMASSRKIVGLFKNSLLKKEDIIKKDVIPVYERIRNQILITNQLNDTIFKKMCKINGIKSYLEKEEFTPIIVPDNSIIFIGDNWFIIYHESMIYSSCLLDFDEKAKIEFNATKNILSEITLSNNQINFEQLEEKLQSHANKGYEMILK